MKLLTLIYMVPTCLLCADGYLVKTSGTTLVATSGDKFYSVTNGTLVLDSGGASTATYWVLSSTNGTTVKGSVNSNDPVFNNVTHYWSLDEASGNARVDSKGSIALNETGGAVSSAAGKHGNAVNFNTAGRYLTSASLMTGSDGSIAFWINLRTLPASGKVFKIANYPGGLQTWIDDAGNVNLCAPGIGNEDDIIASQPLGSLNAWHLIVEVWSDAGAHQDLSVDNATFTNTDQSQFIANDFLVIGEVDVPNSAPTVPDGLIDEIVVWGNVPLTQSDVTTLWNGGSGTWYSP